MNFVKMPNDENIKTTLATVIKSGHTAFLGKCGYDVYGLYLITYDGIVKADNARRTWSSPECNVEVERYVNIEIKVI